MTEREYITGVLGQPDPGPMLDYPHEEDGSSTISPGEAGVMFPRGLPDDPSSPSPLYRLATRGGDTTKTSVPETPLPSEASAPLNDPETQKAQAQTPQGPSDLGVPNRAAQHAAFTGAPDAWARAEKANRNMAATTSLAHSGGVLVRLLASAAAGGAAGGAGGGGAAGGAAGGADAGAGAGAADAGAAGTDAGASSGASFGDNFSAGYHGGGEGTGGYLGRLASNVGGGQYGQGGDMGGDMSSGWTNPDGSFNYQKAIDVAQKSGIGQGSQSGGSGGSGGDQKQQSILNAIEGIGGYAQKRKAALAELGIGDIGGQLTQESDGNYWFGGV